MATGPSATWDVELWCRWPVWTRSQGTGTRRVQYISMLMDEVTLVHNGIQNFQLSDLNLFLEVPGVRRVSSRPSLSQTPLLPPLLILVFEISPRSPRPLYSDNLHDKSYAWDFKHPWTISCSWIFPIKKEVKIKPRTSQLFTQHRVLTWNQGGWVYIPGLSTTVLFRFQRHLFYVYVCACLSACMYIRCLQEPEEARIDTRSAGTGITDGFRASYGC